MISLTKTTFDLFEFSSATGLAVDVVIEIIDIGIIQPAGSSPDDWVFDTHMLGITRRALRLYRELEVDWPGIALALTLIEERDRLRCELSRLKARLARFSDQSAQ